MNKLSLGDSHPKIKFLSKTQKFKFECHFTIQPKLTHEKKSLKKILRTLVQPM